jgi:hypothetical protein
MRECRTYGSVRRARVPTATEFANFAAVPHASVGMRLPYRAAYLSFCSDRAGVFQSARAHSNALPPFATCPPLQFACPRMVRRGTDCRERRQGCPI